jgi:TonB family protein
MTKLNSLLSIIAIFLLLPCAFAQKTKKMKFTTSDRDVEIKYRVLKSDLTTLHGAYRYSYQDETMSQGAYNQGQKDGAWEFGSAKSGLVIQSYFKKGIRDSVWTYSQEGKTACVIYYDEGKVDSLHSFYDDGSLHAQLSVDDNGTGSLNRYYETGSLLQSASIDSFALNGDVKLFYPNGQLFQEVIYVDDRPHTTVSTQDSLGNAIDGGNLQDGTGEFLLYLMDESEGPVKTELVTFRNGLKEGLYQNFDRSGKITTEGQYLENAKNGKWTFYAGEGEKESNYEDEEPDSHFNKRSKARLNYNRFSTFTIVEVMPSFPGGIDGLMAFLSANLVYPNEAKDGGAQGTTYVTFVVNEFGEVIDESILRSVHSSIDKEALRVVSIMPPWVPGMQYGIPVKVQYNLPIRMTLR